jgi:hypothetical protein
MKSKYPIREFNVLKELIVHCPRCGKLLEEFPCKNCGMDKEHFNQYIKEYLKIRMTSHKKRV